MPALSGHLTSVLMRLVWMSYSRRTAFLICFFVARTSVINTCATGNTRCTQKVAQLVGDTCPHSRDE